MANQPWGSYNTRGEDYIIQSQGGIHREAKVCVPTYYCSNIQYFFLVIFYHALRSLGTDGGYNLK